MATAADAPKLAQLKIDWASLKSSPAAYEREEYARSLAGWMTRQGDNVMCVVAEIQERLVGMAWMVVYARVPDYKDPVRLTADIQSVFVLDENRGRGIGGMLIDELCRDADRRGVRLTSVHSSATAIPLYQRYEFKHSDKILARERYR